MKYIFTAFCLLLLFSCSSDDDGVDDGLCWGAIKERSLDGNVIWQIDFKWNCLDCGHVVYYVCPEPGTCGEYNGEPFESVSGYFECE